ncbi:MAG: hypothetical protein ACREV3_05755, partial [Gammaproteobacteria bacterium]
RAQQIFSQALRKVPHVILNAVLVGTRTLMSILNSHPAPVSKGASITNSLGIAMGAEVNGQFVRVSDEDPAIQCRLSLRRARESYLRGDEQRHFFQPNTPKDLVKRRSSELWS